MFLRILVHFGFSLMDYLTPFKVQLNIQTTHISTNNYKSGANKGMHIPMNLSSIRRNFISVSDDVLRMHEAIKTRALRSENLH